MVRVLNITSPVFKQSIDPTTGDMTIAGEAIHAVTTRNGHTFTVEELAMNSAGLKGKPLLKDHVNSVDSIVGRTVDSSWNSEANATMFSARVTDSKMKEGIKNGNIQNVSVGCIVQDIVEVENADTGTTNYCLKGVEFIELSLVAVPADAQAGFGVAQAVLSSLKTQPISSITTTEVKPYTLLTSNITTSSITTHQPIEEKNTLEVSTMENTNQETVVAALSKLSDALSALNDKMAALDKKVEEKTVAPVVVAEAKPESRGVVNNSTEETTAENDYIIETIGNRANITLSRFDKEKHSKLYHGESTPPWVKNMRS